MHHAHHASAVEYYRVEIWYERRFWYRLWGFGV